MFSKLPEDIVLSILTKLEDDPRNWANLACVSTKFSFLIRQFCWKTKCSQTIPSLVSDLISPLSDFSSLHKLSVCCPGLFHAGILLPNSDFGLEHEIDPNHTFQSGNTKQTLTKKTDVVVNSASASACNWSLYDDLYFDTVYNASEIVDDSEIGGVEKSMDNENFDVCKRRKLCKIGNVKSHLASGVWNLCREQGNKLLASRFRGDCLYVCDWPGCVHVEEKRKYMLFRGIFKDFKRSRVWRTLNDGSRSKVDLKCAYCTCEETWDLYSAFCLRRGLGYHEDGEPVVRAYVCGNGHVSGAWTDSSLYT